MKTLSRARALRLAPLLALALAAGCSDLGLDVDGGVVSALTIEDASGATLVTVGSGGSVTGTLSVARGAQRTLTVVLRTSGGTPVALGLGETIRVTVTNPQVASWTETGLGVGVLRGNTTGNTSMRVDLIDAGTVEYTSPSITVQVS